MVSHGSGARSSPGATDRVHPAPFPRIDGSANGWIVKDEALAGTAEPVGVHGRRPWFHDLMSSVLVWA